MALILSWFILIAGFIFLIISPLVVFWKIKIENDDELGEKKLKEKKFLLYYTAIVGVIIMIIGFLLVLIFENKLILKF